MNGLFLYYCAKLLLPRLHSFSNKLFCCFPCIIAMVNRILHLWKSIRRRYDGKPDVGPFRIVCTNQVGPCKTYLALQEVQCGTVYAFQEGHYTPYHAFQEGHYRTVHAFQEGQYIICVWQNTEQESPQICQPIEPFADSFRQ